MNGYFKCTGVQSIINVYAIVSKIENVSDDTCIFDPIDNGVYRSKICNLGQEDPWLKMLFYFTSYSTLYLIKMALCVGYRLKKALNKIIFWILIIEFNFY